MKAIDPQLSAELQELYLENKEWLSDILFLEDEMRFFQGLFDTMLCAKVKRKHTQQVAAISAGLAQLLERRTQLKAVLVSRKKNLEQLLEGEIVHIGLEMIEQDAAIVAEIKQLMANDKLVKNELFTLIESLRTKVITVVAPVPPGPKRSPIL